MIYYQFITLSPQLVLKGLARQKTWEALGGRNTHPELVHRFYVLTMLVIDEKGMSSVEKDPISWSSSPAYDLPFCLDKKIRLTLLNYIQQYYDKYNKAQEMCKPVRTNNFMT
jgi:hypothetical protein